MGMTELQSDPVISWIVRVLTSRALFPLLECAELHGGCRTIYDQQLVYLEHQP